MVTKEQVLINEHFHCETIRKCSKHIGPRGGVTESIVNVRASGKCKTWKRDPNRFHRPVKFGLYESFWIDETNGNAFHLPENCPLLPSSS